MENRRLHVLSSIFALACQLLGSVCSAQDSSISHDRSQLIAAQKMIGKDDFSGLQALEEGAMKVPHSDAARQGSRLELHLKYDAKKSYTNSHECKTSRQEAKCIKYVFISHITSLGIFVVAKLYYESAEYLLVNDRIGDMSVLRSFPNFSPSGNHVLVFITNDDQVGFGLQVWKRDGNRFVLEWSGSPYTEGMYTSYELIRWNTENTIELRAIVSYEPPKHDLGQEFVLSFSANGWGVSEAH